MKNNIPTNLQGLIDTITAQWKFTPEKYKAMENMSEEQKNTFIVTHVLLHINKSTGTISDACEAFDHDNNKILSANPEINKTLIKMLINTLLLMGRFGMSEEEIVAGIKATVK